MLSLTELTQDQIDALQEYLDSLDKGAQERGRRYLEKARVTEVEPYKRGIGFRADVMGTKLYRVKLRFAAGDWDGECSCTVGFDCKHCCAAALQVVADLTGTTPPAEIA